MSEEKAEVVRAEAPQMDVWAKSRPRVGSAPLSSTGEMVYFVSMDGADQHRVVLHNAQNPSAPMPDAEIVAMCVSDKDGNKLFKELSHGIGFMQGRDSCDLRKISLAIFRHSRIPTTQAEAEELEKKS